MHHPLPVTPKKNNECQNIKALPVSSWLVPIRRAPKRLEGLPHDLHHRAIVRRRDQWREAQTKKADNIEIPAKDNNITGGNSMDVLT